ncbi:hypothetical protein [Hyphococcus sp.]|jgi:hypothetical protein|uniref:hypothetical protein n=1 Tax=Hyphococcus sp. TaxID=2038636 RepID=UPI0035C66796
MNAYRIRGNTFKLSETNNWPASDVLKNEPGIYEILSVDHNGDPLSINRFCGVDKFGVLYIGRSFHMRRRLRAFANMILNNSKRGHVAGRTYRTSPKIKKIASPESLIFCFKHLDDVASEESSLLKAYVNKFGEVPPLNGRAEFISKL